jgi:hypothetical protein
MVADSKYSLSFRSCESPRQAGLSSSKALVGCCTAMQDEVRSSIHSFIHIPWILTLIQNRMDIEIVDR